MRTMLILALAVCFPGAVVAQDGVTLRNGKHIPGALVVDTDKDPDGFWVKRLDGGGTVYVRWTQVSAYEKRRLLNKPAGASAGDGLLNGVRIVTTRLEYLLGVMVNAEGELLSTFPEDKEKLEPTIYVKTKDQAKPKTLLRSDVGTYERMRIRESDVFEPSERVDYRLKKANAEDVGQLLEIAALACKLRLYEKAKEIYQKAIVAAPSRKEEISALGAQLDGMMAEQKAEEKLAALRKLAEEGKFSEAIEGAEKFVQEFSETEIGRQNQGLPEQFRKEREEYEKNRDSYLLKKIPDVWRTLRTSLLSEYSRSKYDVREARELIGKMDEEMIDRLSKKFSCSPEDIGDAWAKRDQRKKTVGMGDGSWLHQPGGNGGELDYQGSGSGGDAEDEKEDDFTRRFGSKRDKKKDDRKKEAGNKLETADEWWSSAGSGKRRQWLETEYAMTSTYVTKVKETESPCSKCRGKGTVKATRSGKSVDVTCPRCHGGKVDFSVAYY